MIIEQKHWTAEKQWNFLSKKDLGEKANLVFVFGSRDLLENPLHFTEVRKFYPKATVLLGTTSGEILDTSVYDNTIAVTAIAFEHTQIEKASLSIGSIANSFQAGKKLASSLPQKGLRHVFVVSDGQQVNGSDLVEGLRNILPEEVSLTGGLAGDGARFEKTLVSIDDPPQEGNIAAIGLYGDRLSIRYGSMGGWDTFGPERVITRSEGNVLYELDGQNALSLYKKYLGDQAEGLPATGLLFPLSIWEKEADDPLVRTILSVNEETQSMIFAGDVPQGFHARLMKANFDRLIEGASQAAQKSISSPENTSPEFALLISCVGRKLVLNQRIEEEVESVREILGETTVLTGFYSYGEISPFTPGPDSKCKLHNQTMTITTLSEN